MIKSKTKIIVSFGLCILILILIGVFAWFKTGEYKSAAGLVLHTRKVISEAQSLQLETERIKSDERGFIITGVELFLDPSRPVKADSIYNRIKKLTADNPRQQQTLDSIQRAMRSLIGFSENVIALRRTGHLDEAEQLISRGTGEQLMHKIDNDIQTVISTEEVLLAERLAAARQHFNTTVLILGVTIALSVLMLLITLYYFIREHNKQRLAGKRLAESEQRIKNFLGCLPIGVYVMTADGKPYYANSKSVEILGKGISAELRIGELSKVYNLYKAGTDTMYPPDELPIVKALRGEESANVEDIEVNREGRRVPIRVNTSVIRDSSGKIEYAIAVFEDITDKKETEQRLVEARSMAEASGQLKEKFLANMSHEIRTPMNAIIGFTDLLLRKNLSEQEADYVRTIKTAGENLLRIINDVLDVSKMESGMMGFESNPISLKAIFSSLEAMVSQRARQKNLRLTFAWDSRLPDTLLGDPTRLTQIILNLVGNAIKFTDKGSIEVFAKVEEETEDQYRIAFTVKDSGIGIHANKLPHIFERFTQAESHTARHYGGTGLGLSIAKQLVELQGGTITVTSEPGTGSVFTFVLPFKKTTETISGKRKTLALPDIDQLRNKRILVVEDNPINIKLIQYLFGIYSIDYNLALNGAEAVKKVRETAYDIILMDIEMPEMNGYQATAAIRQDLKSDVPIIAMTAHAMAGEKEKCLEAGMNGYISKPIRENLLFETMVRLTSGDAAATEETPDQKLINLGYLFRTMHNDRQAIRETLDIFLEQLPADLAALNDAVHHADTEAIRRFAHRMKPTVATLGAVTMEKLLNRFEKLVAADTDAETLQAMLDEVNRLARQALAEVQAEREQLLA
jgi:signal transduction histidine kinase/DNA-binding response OmpR family regulator